MAVAHPDQVNVERKAKPYYWMVLVYLFLDADEPSFWVKRGVLDCLWGKPFISSSITYLGCFNRAWLIYIRVCVLSVEKVCLPILSSLVGGLLMVGSTTESETFFFNLGGSGWSKVRRNVLQDANGNIFLSFYRLMSRCLECFCDAFEVIWERDPVFL